MGGWSHVVLEKSANLDGRAYCRSQVGIKASLASGVGIGVRSANGVRRQ